MFDPVRASERIYSLLIRISSVAPPRMRLWDGREFGPATAGSTLVLRHPGALRSMLIPPNDLSAGEAYVYDDIDVEGDIFEFLRFAAGLDRSPRSTLLAIRALTLAALLPKEGRRRPERPRLTLAGRAHTVERDRKAVSYHYDTGNDFFRIFLDSRMVYSCAAFLDPNEDLEAAQGRKLDLICRKLELNAGDRFLDVGCGWGALAIHAAEKYGVLATGITLSREQAQLARERVVEAGLEDRVEILARDYREVEGEFDAIASVGMFEHVGRERLGEYFEKLRSLLAPGGQVLNHGIANRSRDIGHRREGSFVGRYVFPDGELRPLEETVEMSERAGFEVRDVEALRMSYAKTLEHWVANLESRRDEAIAASNEETYRIWRAYMAGSAISFELAAIGVYQVLLSDPERPWGYGRARLLAADDLQRSPVRAVTASVPPSATGSPWPR